ncbi:hypothetical protein SAMN04488691_105125 [Haloferax larsenii]|uniref:Sugar-specific transcriptional regulator TrmB n=1 Tax=Haloferax larsenii TaxID=302484 RepID=A0A1H7QR34_HALLR|nr:hypothetical protein SAMN04488691_105125 [Haloferax larsenii]
MIYKKLADLSDAEQSVVLYLNQTGAASIPHLKQILGKPKLDLYPILKSLERDNLVKKVGNEYIQLV